ncbi:MAG: DUF2064 domain-containing protein [Alphaproteobacteria bacterium]|nr:MAG: DUF2064 domain-containing protein [Alphaproteobacteria bacterium]
MKDPGAIAIFVKTPGISPVKTRLARDIGERAARRFHLLSARATTTVAREFLERNSGWQACFAVAEQEGVKATCWRALPTIWCGRGGLGRRMFQVVETLFQGADRAILIGADTPQIRVSHLETAMNELRRSPWVIGPADDGGFWLLGTRVALPLSVWQAPDYEDRPESVRKDLVNAATDAGLAPPAELELLTDVDRMTDLVAALKQWPDDKVENLDQANLRHWWEGQGSALGRK